VLIEHRPTEDPELATLLVAQQRELREADGGQDGQVTVVRDGAAYLVGVVGGRAVACGAWQHLEPGVAELKRMYVRPAYRGRGIARQLVVALEEEALAADLRVVRLETGTYLPAAIALYRSSGYRPIPTYGEYVGNPYSVCFEKHLAVLVQ
jgi:ribosomal protein S18 acetylase RimI-like enzyme